MAIKWRWDNEEKTRILLEYGARWTWDELHQTQTEVNELVEATTPGLKIDTIHDLRQSVGLPSGALVNIRTLILKMNPAAGNNVFVGTSPFFRSLWNTFAQVYGKVARRKQFMFAETPNEARILLEDNKLAQQG